MPQLVWEIEDNAFIGCEWLRGMAFDSKYFDVNKIFGIKEDLTGEEDKESIDNLATFIEGDENEVVGESAGYQYNEKIVNAVIKEGVKEIEGLAFLNCVNLEQITLPKSLNKVGYGVFNGCNKIKKVVYNGSIEDWCKIDFTKSDVPLIVSMFNPAGISNPMYVAKEICIGDKLVEDLIISKSVEKVGDHAFINGGFKSITIEDGVQMLGRFAFYHCDNVEEIIVPDSVKKIDSYCFSECKKLSKVVIGSGVKFKGSMVFFGCDSLKEIYLKSTKSEIEGNCMVGYSDEESVADVFYYSEEKPTESGKFWHFEGGEIEKW